MKISSKIILRTIGLILIVAAFLFVVSVLERQFLRYIGPISSFLMAHDVLGIVLFILISVLLVLISPFSNWPLVPPAVAVWGSFMTFLMLLAGWFLGSLLAYTLGRYFGEKFFRRHYSFKKIDYYKKKISLGTQFGLVVLFRFAIPSEIASYTLGIIGYEVKRYLLATLLVEIPFAFAAIYLSYTLVTGNFYVYVIIVLAIVALIALASYEFNKKL